MSTSDDSLKETGRCAAASLVEMVAALECDYDRLEKLKEERDNHTPDFGVGVPCAESTRLAHWAGVYKEEAEELAELEEAAGECKDREEAETRIQEDALSVEMRGAWYPYGTEPADAARPLEFMILLATGGPAVRIMGELSNGEPERAWLEVQDWGTPWTRYYGIEQDTLLAYARCFYFGEG